MTREEALRSFTNWSAYAEFNEDIKGSLEVGKLADFAVIDRDLMTCPAEYIKDTQVLLTVSGGEEVYRKDASVPTVMWNGLVQSFNNKLVVEPGKIWVPLNDIVNGISAEKRTEGSSVLVTLDGKSVKLPVKTVDGVEYVAVRALFEGLGRNVTWYAPSNCVSIGMAQIVRSKAAKKCPAIGRHFLCVFALFKYRSIVYNTRIFGREGERVNIQWYPGHMTKTRRQIQADLKLVDLVAEIIDARIPISSRNPDIDELVGEKPRLIVLNRADQADPAMNRVWTDWFRRQGWAVLETNGQRRQGSWPVLHRHPAGAEGEAGAVEGQGAGGRPVRAMVVGVPNVGKVHLHQPGGQAEVRQGGQPAGRHPGQTVGKCGCRAGAFGYPRHPLAQV